MTDGETSYIYEDVHERRHMCTPPSYLTASTASNRAGFGCRPSFRP